MASTFFVLVMVIAWQQHAVLLPLYAGLLAWFKTLLRLVTPKLFLVLVKNGLFIKSRQLATQLLTSFLFLSHRPWRRRLLAARLFVVGSSARLLQRFLASPLWFRALCALGLLAVTATSAYAFLALLIIPQAVIDWLKLRASVLLNKLGITRAVDALGRTVLPADWRRRWRLFAKWRLGRRQVLTSRLLHQRVERGAARRFMALQSSIGQTRDDTSDNVGDAAQDICAVVLGIDVGTSGVRVAALDERAQVLAEQGVRFADAGVDPRDPASWWATLETVLDRLLPMIARDRVVALAVDATSGSLLAIDAAGRPLGKPLMYDDTVDDVVLLRRIAEHLPPTSAAGGATSGLAKAMQLQSCSVRGQTPVHVVHQADWIVGRLGGNFAISDANNALKTGYDPVAEAWPAWLADVGMHVERLPNVRVPGTPIGELSRDVATRFSLPGDVRLLAGTTDGCASFLATGASEPGDAVTALGSTIVLKVLSEQPLFAPEFGLYSHRVGNAWLAGGASNCGGRVLARYFEPDALAHLCARIDPESDSGLDYYPLPSPGERFPICDPSLPPRLTPRPADDATFLHGLLDGLAQVESLGYSRLADIGAPPLRSVRTVGGGASNTVWTRIRERALCVSMLPALSTEAAVGTASLALRGLQRSGLLPDRSDGATS